MSTSEAALVETPAYLSVGDDEVFAVVTHPSGPANGVGIVLAMGGIYKFSIQRNRFQTRLARRLATHGYLVVSYDVHGTGESTGRVDRYALDEPFFEESDAAVRLLEAHGIRDVVLAGSCAGGRACMKTAARLERVLGVALLSVPVVDYDTTMRVVKQAERLPASKLVKRASSRHVLSGVFNRERRARYLRALSIRIMGFVKRRKKDWGVSKNYVEPLERLLERRTPVLMAFGKEPMFGDFQTAKAGYLGTLLSDARDRIELRVYKEHLHGFNTLSIQEEAAMLVEEWVTRIAPGKPVIDHDAVLRPTDGLTVHS